MAARCVALGERMRRAAARAADTVGSRGVRRNTRETWFGIGAESLTGAMTTIVTEIPEIERLFDTAILEADAATSILEQARELLTFRSLQALDQMSSLKETSEELEARTAPWRTSTGAMRSRAYSIVVSR